MEPGPRTTTPETAERNTMSRPAMHRLTFYLLMGVTLYASLVGAG
ncbi:hypothetical protein [Paracoccus marinus]|nr:hypothetical protein [Paracoccus marinus]